MDRYEHTARILRRLIAIVIAAALMLGVPAVCAFAKYAKTVHAGSFSAKIVPSLLSENIPQSAEPPPAFSQDTVLEPADGTIAEQSAPMPAEVDSA